VGGSNAPVALAKAIFGCGIVGGLAPVSMNQGIKALGWSVGDTPVDGSTKEVIVLFEAQRKFFILLFGDVLVVALTCPVVETA